MANTRLKIALVVLLILCSLWILNKGRLPPLAKIPVSELLRQGKALLEKQEAAADADYWGPELEAQTHSRIIEQFWDKLNAASNRFEVVAQLGSAPIMLPNYGPAKMLPHLVQIFDAPGNGKSVAGPEWLVGISRAGWRIHETEFRHVQFDAASGGKPARSVVYFAAQLTKDVPEARAILEGELAIQWSPLPHPAVASIDASRIQCRLRAGSSAFKEVFSEEITPPDRSYFIDPLIVEDLDGDGYPEIILAARNLIYRRTATEAWVAGELCSEPPRSIYTACLADFDGNGTLDFLCVDGDGVLLYEGSEGRKVASSGPQGSTSTLFTTPPRRVWEAHPRFQYAQAITFGDINGDGSLDLFIGQYKAPYTKGQMPTPYFDARDGYPSYLLINDGKGNFSDVTETSGLSTKRHRRVYSASLVDLDHDGYLDLLMVSDFAGADVWKNDGAGHFKDMTANWLPEPCGFGMSHSFADFNGDGHLDILMMGMNSPTADRLEHSGLSRPYGKGDKGMRAKMTYGNRMWFGRNSEGFDPAPANLPIRRTGWAWAAAAADFDNDGFPDLYLTTGHESRESVRDYESEFWLHDIYATDSVENPLLQVYFTEKYRKTRGRGQSYGGYERNRFYLNLGGTNFTEVAHLFGLGLQNDSRCAVAADCNNDGKLDLIVTTLEAFPRARQMVKIFQNEMSIESGLAIAFSPPLSEKQAVKIDGILKNVQMSSNGDGYRSQRPSLLHLAPWSDTSSAKITAGAQSWTIEASTNRRVPLSNIPKRRP